MITMLNYPQRFKFTHTVKMLTGGAPPPPPLMKRFTEETGVSIRTSYGLTESYGPATLHHPDPEWTGESKGNSPVCFLFSCCVCACLFPIVLCCVLSMKQ